MIGQGLIEKQESGGQVWGWGGDNNEKMTGERVTVEEGRIAKEGSPQTEIPLLGELDT